MHGSGIRRAPYGTSGGSFGICALLLVGGALVGGCTGAPAGTAAHAPAATAATVSVSPTVSASPTVAPTVVVSKRPGTTAPNLPGGTVALAAGTYRLDLGVVMSGGEQRWPTLELTVPAGWQAIDRWILLKGEGPDAASIGLWSVAQVYAEPCQWSGTLFDPGPGVDDLANALAAVEIRHATKPKPVTLGGVEGKYMEWTVPADFDFSTCDLDGPYHDFESWTSTGGGDHYQQGPGQRDRLWILNAGQYRLVIDAADTPSTPKADRDELLQVVQSFRFGR